MLIALSLVGLISGARRRPREIVVTAGMFLLPVVLSIAALLPKGRWYSISYTSPRASSFSPPCCSWHCCHRRDGRQDDESQPAGIDFQWALGEQAELGLPIGPPRDALIRLPERLFPLYYVLALFTWPLSILRRYLPATHSH